MNKQEAIEKLKEVSWECEDRSTVIGLDYAQGIISQIEEPQKVTIPKFVAEWIKSRKESFSDVSAIDMYDNLTLDNNGGHYHHVWLWVIDHHYDFIKAWHDGYTVEQEKLYTVEIPDPNSIWKYTFLTNRDPGVSIDRTDGDFWKDDSKNQLTESEIKQDFEWAWQWAKEVE